ncbi:MAG: hypothetical protein DME60_03225 [Verrucomicrobia bacterium]|nr:MAG: hypothetical protein DME60_03225 [Verrucomicrobiota bacterium]
MRIRGRPRFFILPIESRLLIAQLNLNDKVGSMIDVEESFPNNVEENKVASSAERGELTA